MYENKSHSSQNNAHFDSKFYAGEQLFLVSRSLYSRFLASRLFTNQLTTFEFSNNTKKLATLSTNLTLLVRLRL